VAVDSTGIGGSHEGTDIGYRSADDQYIAGPSFLAGAVDDRAAFQED